MSWLDDVIEPETALEVHTVAPSPKQKDKAKQEQLKRIEDSVFEEAADVCSLAMRFAELDYDVEEAPEHWVREHGQEKADKMFRVVCAARLSPKDAPVGIKVATTVLTGLIRSRGERAAPPQLLIMPVVLSTDAPGEARVYPVQVVQED